MGQEVFQKYSRRGAYHHAAMNRDRLYASTVQKALAWVDPPSTILDIGCGDGVFLKYAGLLGAEVCGVDISLSGILLAKEMAECDDRLVAGSANHLPFASAAFDMVVMINVINYLPICNGAISEVLRVLKEGGRLLICSPVDVDLEDERATNPDSWQSRVYSIQDCHDLLGSSFELLSTTLIRRPVRVRWVDKMIGFVRRAARLIRRRSSTGEIEPQDARARARLASREGDIDLNRPRLPGVLIDRWELEYVIVARAKTSIPALPPRRRLAVRPTAPSASTTGL